jgi:hypothetical protein
MLRPIFDCRGEAFGRLSIDKYQDFVSLCFALLLTKSFIQICRGSAPVPTPDRLSAFLPLINRGNHGGIAPTKGNHGGIAPTKGSHGGIAPTKGNHGGIPPSKGQPRGDCPYKGQPRGDSPYLGATTGGFPLQRATTGGLPLQRATRGGFPLPITRYINNQSKLRNNYEPQ